MRRRPQAQRAALRRASSSAHGSTQPSSSAPPREYAQPSHRSVGPPIDTAARNDSGGLSASSWYCAPPAYDWPSVPTVPSDQSWPAIQAMLSKPSAASCSNGTKAPGESRRPRTSCTT